MENDATLRTRCLDILVEDGIGSGVRATLNATYLLTYSLRRSPEAPVQDLLNTEHEPMKVRAWGSISWGRGGLTIAIFANYTNSHRDTASQPDRVVASSTTLDSQISYRVKRMECAFNTQNLFDRGAPFLNNTVGIGYDQENVSLIGRLVSLSLRWDW